MGTYADSLICLSIVIPVYNVERYLGRCLDSLLKTSGIENTEIIIVDDGSSDDSGSIADSYAESHGSIMSFHKDNGGLSDARNYGLNQARGRYVFFCDPDDMVIPEGMYKVIEKAAASDADVLLWDGITVDEDDKIISTPVDRILVHSGLSEDVMMTGLDSMVKQISDHGKSAMTAWLRACRRDYLLDNGLTFREGSIHEDELWTPMVMLGAKSVEYINDKVYCYRMREDSIMGSSSLDQETHVRAYVEIMNELYDQYTGRIDDKVSRDILLANWADTYLWVIREYDAGRYECRSQVPRQKILKASRSCRARVKSLILCIFGVKGYCGFLSR